MTKMTIGYARISTSHGEQTLRRQIDALTKFGVDRIFTDEKTGTTMERDGLRAALAVLRPGDSFVCQDADRIARNYKDLTKIWRELTDNEIEVVILNMPFMRNAENGITNKLINNIFIELTGYLAQLEVDRLHERINDGISAAKKAGVKFGRPKIEIDKETLIILKSWDEKHITGVQAAKTLGISRASLYNIKKQYNELFKIN